jgi:hypothetical protein
MSSYYDCSPETNNTKVKVYGPKTSDIINNITGIFVLLTSIGVTFLIIFLSSTYINDTSDVFANAISTVSSSKSNLTNIKFNDKLWRASKTIQSGLNILEGVLTKANPTYLLFLLTFSCISSIVGLSGMYKKSPNTSIYGFSSFILIMVYTIFLFLSGKLKDITFNSLTDNFFKTIPVAILVILLGTSFGLYFGVYKNVKKSKNRRINSQRKRQRNTAHVIFIFSVVGSVLFALFVSKFMQLNERNATVS